MMKRDSKLLAAAALSAGSLVGLVVQLSNDRTPGTGNLSPLSITCIALFGGQLIWFIAFARQKLPKDELHRRASLFLSAVFIGAMAVYLVVQGLKALLQRSLVSG